MSKIIMMKIFSLVYLVCFMVKVSADTKNKLELVELPEKISKEVLLPLKLLDNPSFNLRKHPFNPRGYWLVNDLKFDSSEATINSYGIAIGTPTRRIFQQFYKELLKSKEAEIYLKTNKLLKKCLVKTIAQTGSGTKELYILLEYGNRFYMILGKEEFVLQNLDIGSVCY